MEDNSSQFVPRPGDLNEDLIISLEEAAEGKAESVTVTRREICEACAGTGQSWLSDDATCASCGNKGSLDRLKEVNVSIPAGIETGTRLRIMGGGEMDPASGTCGELYLTIKVREHELFERRGKHLHTSATVSQEELKVGTEVIIPTLLDGRKRLRIPPGTSSGAVFRLAGLGLRSIESSERGNLFVTVKPPAGETTTTGASAASSPFPVENRRSSLNRIRAGIAAVIGLSIVSMLFFISLSRRHAEPQNQNVNAQPSPTSTPPRRTAVNPPTPMLPLPVRPPFSLPNGSNITPPQGPRGNKYLKIINEMDYDAAVKLVEKSGEKTRRFFYVRAHSNFTVTGVGTGECLLRYSSGIDWDTESRKFLRDASYEQFETPLNFSLINYKVKLKPSITGNAPVNPINETDFEDK